MENKINVEIEIPRLTEYINHLDKPNKGDIHDWEKQRKKIHDSMFEDLEVDRFSIIGQMISSEIDKICARELDDKFQADLKLISSAKNED
ncbi:MAG: hypothetical protein ACFFG0_10480 [Candidatus Thorarchaeota archaeon]